MSQRVFRLYVNVSLFTYEACPITETGNKIANINAQKT